MVMNYGKFTGQIPYFFRTNSLGNMANSVITLSD